ncbi:ATP-binding protein [Streptomyces avicenniae]|uniref:ATP-binding protein n=1 Tax=Streptomyces avicenniae TaxID=500153 RepID=UPI000DA626FB|nr:ATP-binding protein [Streptomyces avicenniae]
MPLPSHVLDLCSSGAAFTWDLHLDARHIETWRRTVCLVLCSWGASDGAVDVARLGVSELLGNVQRHVGDSYCRLSVVLAGGRVTVRVADRSPCVPVVSEPAWDAESGRGLWMLRAMCRDFGCDPEAGGKSVWFVLDLTSSDEKAAV